MKKILLSLAICVGLASFTSQVSAQSTAIAPYDGAKHTYTFGAVENGSKYEFYISTSLVNFGQDNKLTNEYGTMVNGNDTPISFPAVSTGAASVKITWASDAAANYGSGLYLFLRVYTDPAIPADCTPENFKAVHIIPTSSAFNLAVLDDNAGTNPSCANITGLLPVINTDLADPSNYSFYNPGTTTLTYTITRTMSTNDWSGTYKVDCDVNTVDFTVNAVSATAGSYSGTISNIDVNTYLITVVVTNKPGVTPTFTLEILSGTDDVTGVVDVNLGTLDAKAAHTINLIPAIGTFTGS